MSEGKKAERTPGPWCAMPANPKYIEQTDEKGSWGLIIADCSALDEAEANAAFIVEACNSHDALLAQRDELVKALEWQPIATAPKDETVVDLLYPYPRGRTIDCYWEASKPFCGTWISRRPTWSVDEGKLLPETEWSISTYPNMEPTHWRVVPTDALLSRIKAAQS